VKPVEQALVDDRSGVSLPFLLMMNGEKIGFWYI
jgi:hypothetical protein